MTAGRIYDGRRQHQGRRPAHTPRQNRTAGFVVLFAIAATCCFCGGALVAAAMWLVGWVQV